MPRPHYTEWTREDWILEVVTQFWQQPLHAGWSFLTTFLPFLACNLTGDLGLFGAVIRGVVIGFAVLSALVIVAREVQQGSSRRPWDPPLDYAFFIAGAVGGVVAGLGVL